MTEKSKEYIKKWLEIAEHDFEAAETIFEYNPVILDVACFHCQQAVEKYLKAFLAYSNKNFDKTHDVILLRKLCSKIDKDFSLIDLKDLNDYAVGIRYPDDYLMPSAKEAREYYKVTVEIKGLVLKKIKI